MNNRLNIQDLAGLLSEHTGKEREEIERFLKEFIAVVLEGVYTDKLIKVKGLGTFKIISVDKRESIHVNTGERFLIPEHYKFSFLPDKDLKEQVNKPFSFFETTEISENVNFPDMEEPEEEKDLDLEDESVEEVMPDREIPIIDTIKEPEPVETAGIAPESKEEPDLDLLPSSEPSPDPTLLSDSLPEPMPAIEPESNPAPVPEKEVIPHKSGHKGLYLGIVAVILVAISSIIIYIGKERWLKAPVNKVILQVRDTLSPDSAAKKEGTSYIIYPDSVNERMPHTDPAPYQEPKTKVLDYVEIKHGDRLTVIALKYYGSKLFWVYIYQHNKNQIKDPNNVPIGTVVEIPVPELYGIDVNNRESREKAAALQTEILSGT